MKRILSSIIAVIFVAIGAIAQTRIDKIVSELEKDANVQVTYTEQRNPKTKKIEKTSTILVGASKKHADKLWDAFEAERPNSVSVSKHNNQTYVIKFEKNDYVASYVLSVTAGRWSLVVSMQSNASANGFSSVDGCDFNVLDGLCLSSGFEMEAEDFEQLKSFEGLGQLISLKTLESLKGLSKLGEQIETHVTGNIKVYDSEGNIIYDNSKDNSSAKNKTKKQSGSKSKSTSTSSGKNKTRTVTTTVTDGKTVTEIYYM